MPRPAEWNELLEFLRKEGLRAEFTVHPEAPGVCGHPIAISRAWAFLSEGQPTDEELDG